MIIVSHLLLKLCFICIFLIFSYGFWLNVALLLMPCDNMLVTSLVLLMHINAFPDDIWSRKLVTASFDMWITILAPKTTCLHGYTNKVNSAWIYKYIIYELVSFSSLHLCRISNKWTNSYLVWFPSTVVY